MSTCRKRPSTVAELTACARSTAAIAATPAPMTRSCAASRSQRSANDRLPIALDAVMSLQRALGGTRTMPELPEVERARALIERRALGRRIAAVDDTDTYVCRPHAPGEIAAVLEGRT